MRLLACLLVPLLAAAAHGQDGDRPGSITGRVDHLYVRLRPAVVHVRAVAGRTFEPPDEAVVLDQREMRFEPRVLPALVGSTLRVTNSDSFRHNAHDRDDPDAFDLQFRPGQSHEVDLVEPGVIEVRCRFHSSMIAWVVVVETPWFATTDPDGAFEITGLPPGEYRLTMWHERLASETLTVRVDPGRPTEVLFEPGD